MTKSEGTREYDDSFWLDGETYVIREEPETTPVYDLGERTARFGEMSSILREQFDAIR